LNELLDFVGADDCWLVVQKDDLLMNDFVLDNEGDLIRFENIIVWEVKK